ncbi:MAG: DNA/RNA non-specific endonuclease [Saprospiraceae bacterium]
MSTRLGFKTTFISKNLKIELPELDQEIKTDLLILNNKSEWKYPHYSLAMSKTRKFAYYTASNINGKYFKSIKRDDLFPSGNDEWKGDEHLLEYQWKQELYDAPKSNFDRGHLVKREDVQWGYTKDQALLASQDTFTFTNCTPQVAELNQKKWGRLELYILKKEAVKYKLKICVLTGPVLNINDPYFVSEVQGQQIKLPLLFWKVVYYSTDGIHLNKVGFLMGQQNLLAKKGIIDASVVDKNLPHFKSLENHFNEFEDAETYQVSLSTIEHLSNLKFSSATEPYTDPRPIKMVIHDVQVKNLKSKKQNPLKDFVEYEGMRL